MVVERTYCHICKKAVVKGQGAWFLDKGIERFGHIKCIKEK